MTESQTREYINLMDRRMFILMHNGVDWKPEYGPELEAITKRLFELRSVVDEEHKKKESDSATVPTMTTIRAAAKQTGLSYEFIRQLIREGKISYVQAGKKFLVNMERLVEYLNRGEKVVEG